MQTGQIHLKKSKNFLKNLQVYGIIKFGKQSLHLLFITDIFSNFPSQT